MGAKPPLEPSSNSPRTRRWYFAWIGGVATGVITALVASVVADQLENPSRGEQLTRFVDDQRNDGSAVVAFARLPLEDPQRKADVLVIRPADAKESDQLVVLASRDGDLHPLFRFQPTPGESQIRELGIVEASRPARPYRISLRAVTNLSGTTGTDDVLITLGGPDPYLRYPLVLSFDQLSQQFSLTGIFGPKFPVGPAPLPRLRRGEPYRTICCGIRVNYRILDSYRLVRALYNRRTVLRDVRGRMPEIKSLGADAITLIEDNGELYLVAGFAVAEKRSLAGRDRDCELELLDRGPGICTSIVNTDPRPSRLNVKAWRFLRQGVGVRTRACGGSRVITRARQGNDVEALRRTWKRYRRATREC